jgi:hypothetical protein
MEELERAEEVVPARRVGGMGEEEVEEDGGGGAGGARVRVEGDGLS